MTARQRGFAHRAVRRATAAAHHALDHHPVLQGLTGGNLTRDQYAESLAALYRPQGLLEQAVLQSPHRGESGLVLSSRLGSLEADLVELGWPLPALAHNPPQHSSSHAAWCGQAYVLEGARRGGMVIASRVQASLGDSVPCRFFAGAIVGDGFDAVLAMLECGLEESDELQQAIAGALSAFSNYQAGLDDPRYAGEVGAPAKRG